jgi:hypothetical protein
MAQQLGSWDNTMPCVPRPLDSTGLSPMVSTFIDRLPAVAARYPHISLMSRFDANFLCGGTRGTANLSQPPAGETFALPWFYSSANSLIEVRQGSEAGFRPYGLYSLWHRKQVPVEDLQSLGLIDVKNGVITLRGITHINGSLELPPVNGGPWTVRGQGVLAANSFMIKTGIRRDPNDPQALCVLMARRGDIIIDTDQLVEASCLAFNDQLTGTVRALRPMHLRGALVCDRLGLPNAWSAQRHLLEYDPRLSGDHSQHQIWISRWVTFHRISEQGDG